MEISLDESSLVACDSWRPDQRIQTMAFTLKALDELGCARVLRSVRAAADLEICEGRGLRQWCFAVGTNRDAGKLIAMRLGKQPFIDGTDGLFVAVEGERAIEGRVLGETVVGLAFAALTGAHAVALGREELSESTSINVDINTLDDDHEFQETVSVCRVVTENDVQIQSGLIHRSVENSVADGGQLLERANDLFPRLRFGHRATQQITSLNGSEPVFHQLFRHLRALDLGVKSWRPDSPYSPAESISWNIESGVTLNHGTYGPMRDFPMPNGFTPRRWSNHTKLSGGAGARLYFDPERNGKEAVVLIGYFGNHLPTVKFPG